MRMHVRAATAAYIFLVAENNITAEHISFLALSIAARGEGIVAREAVAAYSEPRHHTHIQSTLP